MTTVQITPRDVKNEASKLPPKGRSAPKKLNGLEMVIEEHVKAFEAQNTGRLD